MPLHQPQHMQRDDSNMFSMGMRIGEMFTEQAARMREERLNYTQQGLYIYDKMAASMDGGWAELLKDERLANGLSGILTNMGYNPEQTQNILQGLGSQQLSLDAFLKGTIKNYAMLPRGQEQPPSQQQQVEQPVSYQTEVTQGPVKEPYQTPEGPILEKLPETVTKTKTVEAVASTKNQIITPDPFDTLIKERFNKGGLKELGESLIPIEEKAKYYTGLTKNAPEPSFEKTRDTLLEAAGDLVKNDPKRAEELFGTTDPTELAKAVDTYVKTGKSGMTKLVEKRVPTQIEYKETEFDKRNIGEIKDGVFHPTDQIKKMQGSSGLEKVGRIAWGEENTAPFKNELWKRYEKEYAAWREMEGKKPIDKKALRKEFENGGWVDFSTDKGGLEIPDILQESGVSMIKKTSEAEPEKISVNRANTIESISNDVTKMIDKQGISLSKIDANNPQSGSGWAEFKRNEEYLKKNLGYMYKIIGQNKETYDTYQGYLDGVINRLGGIENIMDTVMPNQTEVEKAKLQASMMLGWLGLMEQTNRGWMAKSKLDRDALMERTQWQYWAALGAGSKSGMVDAGIKIMNDSYDHIEDLMVKLKVNTRSEAFKKAPELMKSLYENLARGQLYLSGFDSQTTEQLLQQIPTEEYVKASEAFNVFGWFKIGEGQESIVGKKLPVSEGLYQSQNQPSQTEEQIQAESAGFYQKKTGR